MVMEDVGIEQKALDALVFINTAIKNVRLYPPTSGTIINNIEKLHQAFLDMFEQEAPLIFAESEKNILICGKPLSQKDQEKFQVTALLNILLSFSIKSITFNKGLQKEELGTFMELLSQKPESVKSEGGLIKIMTEKNISHINLDQKVYVAVDKDHKIISSIDITDDQITKFFISTHPELAADTQNLQKMAKDPEWLLQTFQSGLSQMMAQKGTLSKLQLSESLENMIVLLDKVAGKLDQKDRDKLSHSIGKAISTIDPNLTNHLTTQNMERLFGGVLLQYIVSELKEAKFIETHKSTAGGSPEGRSITNAGKTDYQNQLSYLKERLSLHLKDNKKTLLDASLMSILPKIIEQLIVQKEHGTMEMIISRLLNNLSSESEEVRAQASKALADIIESLSPERKRELIERLSGQLIKWIKLETLATSSYKKICNSLQNLVRDFIHEGRFTEIIPILDVFSNINAGILEKNDKSHEISSEIISALASKENLTILFKAFNTNDPKKQVQSGEVLVRLGNEAMNRLLDILMSKEDSDERIRIMKLFIEMGRRAVPVIRDHLNEKAPWYYLRNMAYILGHIGNEASAIALKPLLLHKKEKLRMEALKSIHRIGGSERGPLLLSILPEVDDQFKLNIIEALGNAKCADAVNALLDILKNKPLVVKSSRADLEEKICIALGSIGSTEAIPALSEIAESRSFLRVRAYPSKVKNAASQALASIRKKQAEAGITKH
jgi:HEAT repeat protein